MRAEQHQTRRKDKDNVTEQATGNNNNEQDNNKASDMNDLDLFSLFVPTPPDSALHTGQATQGDTPRSARAAAVCEERGACSAGMQDVCSDSGRQRVAKGNVDNLSFPRSGVEEDASEILKEAGAAGYDLQAAKHHVGEVRDRLAQRQFRDPQRNHQLKKVVFDGGPMRDRKLLVGQSDDLYLVYDCEQRRMVEWYISPHHRKATRQQQETTKRLLGNRPTDPRRNAKDIDFMCSQLQLLGALVRHLLG